MKLNKQKTDWENIKSLLLCEKYIYYCDLNNEDLDKLSKFISQLLKTQREEIVSEIEGIVIGKLENFRASKLITSDILDKVLKVGETDWNIQIDENNRRLDELEKEIRERLKQI